MNSKWIRIITLYHPPPSTTNGLTTAKFFFEFAINVLGTLNITLWANLNRRRCQSSFG